MDQVVGPPGPLDVLVTLGQIIGVPGAILTAVLSIGAASEWIRFGAAGTRMVGAVAGAVGDHTMRAAARVPERVGRIVVALLAQTGWVVLIYLGCRMVIKLPMAFDAGSEGGGWERFFFAVVSLPTESSPWTGWVALFAIGVAASLSFSLVFRSSLNSSVAAAVMVGPSMALGIGAAMLLGIGGGFICVLAFIATVIFGLASGDAATAVFPWAVTWAIVALTGAVGWAAAGMSNLAVVVTGRALWTGWDPPKWIIRN